LALNKINQLNDSHLRPIASTGSYFHYPRITAIPIGEAWYEVIEDFLDYLFIRDCFQNLSPRMEVSPLSQGD
jgi:hypothetical protein